MPQPQEIELKFQCAPEDLGRVLAAAPDGEDDTAELISVYFDTPGGDLRKAGASLRVRESRGRRVQTLKRGDGLAREEHESPIAGDAPDPTLGPLSELLPKAAELKPAFHVRITRRQRLVRFADAEIELALDQGEVRGGQRSSPISEVELELKSGAPAALFDLARELSHAAPIYLSFASKASRGQALMSGEPLHVQKSARPAPEQGATVAAVFQGIGRSTLKAIAGNAEVLRERADPAALHQLRVAARTLRSALSTFKVVVADGAFKRIKGELRWLAKACNQARNLDVFSEEAEGAAKLDPAPGALAELTTALEAARARAYADVAQTVGSTRFRDLLIEVTGWVDTGAWLERPEARKPAKPFAFHMLHKRRKKVVKDGQRLEAQSDDGRHQVRIDAKKLRYAAEGFQGLFPAKPARRFIEKLKALQDELGALNDLATQEPMLVHLTLRPEAAFAAGEIVGRKAADKPKLLAKASKALKRLEESKPFWC